MDSRFKELEVTKEHGMFEKRRFDAPGGRREEGGRGTQRVSRGRLCVAPRVILSCSDPSGYHFNLKSPIPPLVSAVQSSRRYFWENGGIQVGWGLCVYRITLRSRQRRLTRCQSHTPSPPPKKQRQEMGPSPTEEGGAVTRHLFLRGRPSCRALQGLVANTGQIPETLACS